MDKYGRPSAAAAKPVTPEDEEEELKLRDQMPLKVEALTLEEKQELKGRLGGDDAGVLV